MKFGPPHPSHSHSTKSARAHGFTIVELLVVVAIIIALLSILIVAVNSATRASQKANTLALMDSIHKGLIRFKEDIGYYPPVLGPSAAPITELRRLYVPPVPGSAGYNNNIQQWWSTCSISEYLLGYGNHWQDGYGIVSGAMPAADALHDWDSETPSPGIRHPGPDGVWGAGTNTMFFRMGGNGGTNVNSAYSRTENTPIPIDQGKVYGPYIELKDSRLLGAISGYDANNQPIVVFPGDQGYNETLPKTIVDYWGMPLRYYRRPYPTGALSQSYRTGSDINRDGIVDQQDLVPTLSDIWVLRPQSVKPGAESINRFGDMDPGIPGGFNISSRELDAAEFAILSSGPDKTVNLNVLQSSENADNIVEIGP